MKKIIFFVIFALPLSSCGTVTIPILPVNNQNVPAASAANADITETETAFVSAMVQPTTPSPSLIETTTPTDSFIGTWVSQEYSEKWQFNNNGTVIIYKDGVELLTANYIILNNHSFELWDGADLVENGEYEFIDNSRLMLNYDGPEVFFDLVE
jgi:hypothetical protein